MSESKKMALDKALRALKLVSAAQAALASACAELFVLEGLSDQWTDVSHSHDRLHQLREKLNLRIAGGHFDLDPDSKRRHGFD